MCGCSDSGRGAVVGRIRNGCVGVLIQGAGGSVGRRREGCVGVLIQGAGGWRTQWEGEEKHLWVF